MPTQERAKLESEIRALEKNEIHRLVLAVEGDPLSKLAEAIRPTLVIYFEPIDYTVCLDQIGFLLQNEPMAWSQCSGKLCSRVATSSFRASRREQIRPSDMLAGLEAGLRVYERMLAAKPELKHAEAGRTC